MDNKYSFTAESLRQSLSCLNLSVAPTDFSSEQVNYLQYYGLDFGKKFRDLKHFFGSVQANQHALATHCWVPTNAKGTIVVVHGLFDHAGLYRHLIEHLLSLDYAVFCFDLPGHGLSDGELARIESFDEYVEALQVCFQLARRALPYPLHLIGQSTGCSIIMQWILSGKFQRKDFPADKVVLLAPLVRPYLWNVNRFLYWVLRLFIKERQRRFVDGTEEPGFQYFVKHDDPLQANTLPIAWLKAMVRWQKKFSRSRPADISVKIIQGNNDRTVDWKYNVGIIKQKLDARLLMLEGARHHLVNEKPDMRELIFDDIARELG